MRILVDMDNTIADFDGAVRAECEKRGCEFPSVRDTFELSGEPDAIFRDIATKPGFFSNLSPIPGAISALLRMKATGVDVWICTSPMRSSPYCIPEKYEWVIRHLGIEWTEKLIFTKDKTLISADLLIDDKVQHGCEPNPTWVQLCFAQSYNLSYPRRLNDWSKWGLSIEDSSTS